MAKQPVMINRVIDLLGEGKTAKEITEDTGCSKATVTVARKRLKERENDLTEATEDINNDVDENIDSFIKTIKIKPDPDVLTKDKVEVEDTDYECPNCHHTWDAPKKEHQEQCPSCGLEFE